MELRGKHVLLISPEPWQGVKNSKHHMAQALADRGNEVCFWGPGDRTAKSIEVVGTGRLKHVRYRHWFKGVRRFPKAVHQWYYRRMIGSIERANGHPFDVIWCFDTSRMQWFPGDGRIGILHLVDLDILHQGAPLMRSADIVLTTSAPIRQSVIGEAPQARVHQVGHALYGDWLVGAETLFAPRSRPPRTIAFAGLLATRYVDHRAMRSIITAHPELEFHLYGPYDHPDTSDPDLAINRRLPNTHWHGLVPKEDLIPALRNADLLFFFYRSDILLDQLAYPHKMLEYLSTGNPVVCSRTLEFDGRSDLVRMAMDRTSAVETFRQALASFGADDAEANRKHRINFAREHTIGAFLDRIERLIP